MLPQLAAAYNLARWLVIDPQCAEDVVRDAVVRASGAFGQVRSDAASGRAWLLGFVRAACHARLGRERIDTDAIASRDDGIDRAIAALPVSWRECIVLHDIEGLSYADLARVIDVPVGTALSRLVDARCALASEVDDGPKRRRDRYSAGLNPVSL